MSCIYECNNMCMVCYAMSIDLRPTEHIPVVKVIFNGDGTFLPCVINTSHGVFPMPDRVEWRKDGRGLENGVR